jgi:TonB family protein
MTVTGLSVRSIAAVIVAVLALMVGPASAQATRLRVGGDVKEPIKIKTVAPVYPEAAKDEGVSGVVILEIVVGTDGRVLAIEVLRSIPLLDDAAATAVSQWQYAPTVIDEEPVELEMVVVVNFVLPDE